VAVEAAAGVVVAVGVAETTPAGVAAVVETTRKASRRDITILFA
jgi:hypothetical protein